MSKKHSCPFYHVSAVPVHEIRSPMHSPIFVFLPRSKQLIMCWFFVCLFFSFCASSGNKLRPYLISHLETFIQVHVSLDFHQGIKKRPSFKGWGNKKTNCYSYTGKRKKSNIFKGRNTGAETNFSCSQHWGPAPCPHSHALVVTRQLRNS